MKKLVIVLSLLGFSSAALACKDHEATTATKEKAPAVAKASKKAPKVDVKKGEKKS
jgi:hypothetical protein